MSRKRASVAMIIAAGEPPSPPQRRGSLVNADPSGAIFARNIHTFNHPESGGAQHGDDASLRTVNVSRNYRNPFDEVPARRYEAEDEA